MTPDSLPPDFPTEIGGEVTFTKDGSEYRLLRYDSDTWLIHKAHIARESFELILTPDGSDWVVEGKGHMGPITAMGVSKGLIFSKLF